MPLQEYQSRAYLLPVSSVHTIRECLQVIMDYAEHESNEVVLNQVHRIIQEIAGTRVTFNLKEILDLLGLPLHSS